MLPLQNHVRTPVKHFEHIRFVVLATQTDQETVASKLHHQSLHVPPGWRNCNTFDTLFANDSLPDRVVTVQDNHLEGRARNRIDPPSQNRCQSDKEERSVGDVPKPVPLKVISFFDGILQEITRANQMEIGNLMQRACDLLFDLFACRSERQVGLHGRRARTKDNN